MPNTNLVSGDLVVDLASLLRSSAVFAGAVSGLVSIWILKRSAPWKVGGFVLGGVAGFLLGSFIGPLIFFAPEELVTVVKVGPGALGLTLKAGLIGGISAGFLVSLASSFIASQASRRFRLIGVGVAIGFAVGAFSAYMASRV